MRISGLAVRAFHFQSQALRVDWMVYVLGVTVGYLDHETLEKARDREESEAVTIILTE